MRRNVLFSLLIYYDAFPALNRNATDILWHRNPQEIRKSSMRHLKKKYSNSIFNCYIEFYYQDSADDDGEMPHQKFTLCLCWANWKRAEIERMDENIRRRTTKKKKKKRISSFSNGWNRCRCRITFLPTGSDFSLLQTKNNDKKISTPYTHRVLF